MTQLEIALKYLQRGWSVIPLHPRDKKPAISWQSFSTKHPSRDLVTAWFKGNERNIGIPTGAVSGIIVLDIDKAKKEGDADGFASLALIEADRGALPDTLTATTGSGGRHYVFKHPGGTLTNFSRKKIGIDFRGDGGFIVVAPSLHPSGGVYEWNNDLEPADCPEWLAELASGGPEPDWYLKLFTPKKAAAAVKTERLRAIRGNYEAGKAKGAAAVLAGCAFCRHCKDDAAMLPENEWYAMVTNLAPLDDGPAAVHELSKPYSGYSERETERKIEHALQSDKPHTCQYIQNNVGFDCPNGGCGVTAPIGFATDAVAGARGVVASLIDRMKDAVIREEVFAEDVIGALAVLKRKEPAELAIVKGQIKDLAGRDISMRDLNSAITERAKRDSKLKVVEKLDDAPPMEGTWLEKKPFEFAVRKFGDWNISERGITRVIFTDQGPQEATACDAPIFISRRMKRVDGTADARVELTWWRDNEWQKVALDKDMVSMASKVPMLSNLDIPVNSEMARTFVGYMSEFEKVYGGEIPLVKTVSRLGWYGSNHFFPGVQGDMEIDNPDMKNQQEGFHGHGELIDWVSFIEPLRAFPIARFMLACSFASPLLRIVNGRIFIFHAYGGSRGGKTAALSAALSVWGRPEDIMANFNTTAVGIEQLCGFYNDLPVGLDEQQVAGRKQDFIDKLVYALSMGKGKTRGSKGGGIREYQSWKNIILTTGEDPISADNSTAGVKTRTLEVYGRPIPDELKAQAVHRGINGAYGVAGPTYIQALLALSKENPRAIMDDFERMVATLQEGFPDNLTSHLSSVAAACLGDFYASRYIFGMEEIDAWDEALLLAETMFPQLVKQAEVDDATRAYDYLMDWTEAHEDTFADRPRPVWSGFIGDRVSGAPFDVKGYTFYFPTVFDEVLREGNFNPTRILKDWAQNGMVLTDQRKGEAKVRHKVRRRVYVSYGEDASKDYKYFVGVKRRNFDEEA
ncbi:DUF927 domain-containing protein [Paenibacillus pasadenensis]|uniref:DUF927 domain-containing protein n=1 Tax=Paenibacillus pasadenensis TaxID=217090 RepID=UPI00203C1AE6|nr:DUF927 domain-containing protein [Paenibacillus pasadenensis]MCM3746561.1 DUF927 domain-containing protein [Paenibacillus pasadenensis]